MVHIIHIIILVVLTILLWYISGTEIMVKYLVEHGVDINKEDNTGYIRMC